MIAGKMSRSLTAVSLRNAKPAYGAADYPIFMREVDDNMRDLLRRWLGGMDASAFYIAFDQILFDGHTQAHLIGQAQGGAAFPSIGFGRFAGRQVADEETFFLRGFVDDMLSGKYTKDGEVQAFRILDRMRMYQGKMRGTAARGFVDSSKDEDRFIWKLGGAEDHCGDCPELAQMSAEVPFDKSTLFQYPGDGSTPCLWNCKCHLVRLRDDATTQRPL